MIGSYSCLCLFYFGSMDACMVFESKQRLVCITKFFKATLLSEGPGYFCCWVMAMLE